MAFSSWHGFYNCHGKIRLLHSYSCRICDRPSVASLAQKNNSPDGLSQHQMLDFLYVPSSTTATTPRVSCTLCGVVLLCSSIPPHDRCSGLCLLFCMGVKPGRSHWGSNAGWGCLRIGCWGEYLGLREMRKQGSGENYIMRNLMVCTPHPILIGWSNWEEWDG